MEVSLNGSLDLEVSLNGSLDLEVSLNGSMDLVVALNAAFPGMGFSLLALISAVVATATAEGVAPTVTSIIAWQFSFNETLADDMGNTFSLVRQSVAYNSAGVLVAANLPVYEDVV